MSLLPKSLGRLIDELGKLPGIGPKTATRLAYHLLRASDEISTSLINAISDVKGNVRFCSRCFGVSEGEICPVCADNSRDSSLLCIVEEPLDLFAIEGSGVYYGLYFVLGGVISPVNGIGPEDLKAEDLFDRVREDAAIREIIIATNPNLEGEATAMYLQQKLTNIKKDIRISRIARGLPAGADLEYADNVTLKKSLEGRLSF